MYERNERIGGTCPRLKKTRQGKTEREGFWVKEENQDINKLIVIAKKDSSQKQSERGKKNLSQTGGGKERFSEGGWEALESRR